MTLPAVLKIGSAEYRVKLSESLDMFGTTDNRSSKIKIAAWQADDQQRATMMHESLHAVLFCAGAEKLIGMDYDAEERLVSLLEPWLLMLLRDNPDLVALLVGP